MGDFRVINRWIWGSKFWEEPNSNHWFWALVLSNKHRFRPAGTYSSLGTETQVWTTQCLMMMVMIDDNHHNAVADDYSVYANLYIYIILDNRYDIIIYIFTQYHNYHNCLYFGNGGGFWRFLIFQHLKNNRGYWVQPSPVLDSPGNLKSKGPRSMLSGACCSRTAWR